MNMSNKQRPSKSHTVNQIDHQVFPTDVHEICDYYVQAYGCKTERVTTAIFEVDAT